METGTVDDDPSGAGRFPRMTDETIALEELTELLSRTVGREKAQAAVEQTARELNLDTSKGLHRDDALKVLDTLAEGNDIVGVTARFAKSRLHLRWAKEAG